MENTKTIAPKMIDRVRMAISLDSEDNMEGLVAVQANGVWMPLVAADEDRFHQIEMLAEAIAVERGIKIDLIEFDTRKSIREIDGREVQ